MYDVRISDPLSTNGNFATNRLNRDMKPIIEEVEEENIMSSNQRSNSR